MGGARALAPAGRGRHRPASAAGSSPRAAALAGLAVGLLALVFSWHPSLWSDEAASISAARRSLPELWAMVGSIDLVHGLYYALLHGWIEVFGASAFSVRLPSALLLGAAGAAVHGLATRLAGPRAAAGTVAVFALLPRAFWSGAEARPYALTVLLAAAATLVLLAALGTRSVPAWSGYGLLLLAGVLANLYVALLAAAHLVSLLLDRQVTAADRRRWLVAAGAAGLAAVPFLLGAYGQAGQLGDRGLGPVQLVRNVLVNQWFLGDTPTPTTGSAGIGDGGWWLPAALVLAAAGWALVARAVVTRTRAPAGRPAPGRDGSAPDRDGPGPGPDGPGRPGRDRLVVWALPWLVVPTAVIGLYSLAVTPMYSPRYLTFATPAVALLLAAGLAAVRPRALRAGVAGLLVLAALPVLVAQRQESGKNGTDWSAVATYVGANARPGDGVYFTPRYDLDEPTVGQTARGIAVAYPGDFAGLRDLTLLRTPAEADNLVGESRRLRDSGPELARVDTVWVVRRADWPRAAEDDRFLAGQGFTGGEVWRGPLDVVLRFGR